MMCVHQCSTMQYTVIALEVLSGPLYTPPWVHPMMVTELFCLHSLMPYTGIILGVAPLLLNNMQSLVHWCLCMTW